MGKTTTQLYCSGRTHHKNKARQTDIGHTDVFVLGIGQNITINGDKIFTVLPNRNAKENLIGTLCIMPRPNNTWPKMVY